MQPNEPPTSVSEIPGEPQPEDQPADLFAAPHADIEQLRTDAEGKAERVVAERSFWRELPILILIALVVAVVIKTFFVQAFFIPSGSMRETLEVNDRVLVSKLSYTLGDISRGDVIVFDDPRGPASDGESIIGALVRNLAESVGLSTPKSEFIKRVIAVGGETIEIRDGVVLVDGVAIEEDYLGPGVRMSDFGPETVPEGFVFVMGDNRSSSQDSRVFGPIPTSDIVGRAFTIIWPPSNWSGL